MEDAVFWVRHHGITTRLQEEERKQSLSRREDGLMGCDEKRVVNHHQVFMIPTSYFCKQA
jgi:hypothetical protein